MLDQEERWLTYAEVGELLGTANRRADDDRARADRAEQQVATLQAELVELRVSERAAADLAEYATGEATDLRKRLDAAEQRVGEERERADQAERTAARSSARAQELTTQLAVRAATRCAERTAVAPKLIVSQPPSAAEKLRSVTVSL